MKKTYAVVKMLILYVVLILNTLANPQQITYVVSQAILIVMESAGPKINHAVMLQLSIAPHNTTNVLITAAVKTLNSAVKLENNATPSIKHVVAGTNKNAMENVFPIMTIAVPQEHHGVNLQRNALNIVVMNKMDFPGVLMMKNVKNIAALMVQYTVIKLINVSPISMNVALLIPLTANTQILARLTVASMTHTNMKFGVLSRKLALMNVIAAIVVMKHVIVRVEFITQTLTVITKMLKSAATTSGVKLLRNV